MACGSKISDSAGQLPHSSSVGGRVAGPALRAVDEETMHLVFLGVQQALILARMVIVCVMSVPHRNPLIGRSVPVVRHLETIPHVRAWQWWQGIGRS
jgi:hypothetical protein